MRIPHTLGLRWSDAPIDVFSGFLRANDDVQGRPVGVFMGKRSALLVADDVGDVVA